MLAEQLHNNFDLTSLTFSGEDEFGDFSCWPFDDPLTSLLFRNKSIDEARKRYLECTLCSLMLPSLQLHFDFYADDHYCFSSSTISDLWNDSEMFQWDEE